MDIATEREKANIFKLLQPIKDTWSEKGEYSYRWIDVHRTPLIDFTTIECKTYVFESCWLYKWVSRQTLHC